MTPVERHAELVYAESLFERVSKIPFATLPPPHPTIGIAGDYLFW